MDAPAELLSWSAEFDAELGAAWDQCPSPVWLMWLAGAAGTALDQALLVVLTWSAEVATSVPEAEELVRQTLESVEESARRGRGEACAAAAERAEAASRSAPASFRAKPPLGFEALTMAAAWAARAAEGLVASRKRAEAVRMQRAQHMASFLGTGVDTTVQRETPMCLDTESLPDSPVHAELLYVVAALAQTALYLVSTREAQDPDRPRVSLEEEEADLVRALFKAL
ncbi:MAG: hypothetical protein AB8H86_05200 [Polyangiales bacterium]